MQSEETIACITVGLPIVILALGIGIGLYYLSTVLPIIKTYWVIVPALIVFNWFMWGKRLYNTFDVDLRGRLKSFFLLHK